MVKTAPLQLWKNATRVGVRQEEKSGGDGGKIEWKSSEVNNNFMMQFTYEVQGLPANYWTHVHVRKTIQINKQKLNYNLCFVTLQFQISIDKIRLVRGRKNMKIERIWKIRSR